MLAALCLLFALAFNLYHLYPEVAIRVPMLNDGVLHLLSLERVAAALADGQDPTDVWLAPINLGYPLFHYYQHLAYLPPAALHLLLGGRLALDSVYHWTNYLLLSLFPLAIYWSMRRFGFARWPSALAGLVASLIATNGLYGFDFVSYVWGGYGLYTQLWGMLLLPLALGQGYVALRTGRGYFWAVLLLAATLLSHLVYGYIALISLVLIALLTAPETDDQTTLRWWLWQSGQRLALLFVLSALVIAYFLVPFLLDHRYMNRSIWEEASKYDSYGYQWVMGALLRGELFDYGRFPTFTLVVGLGLIVCLWRWREPRYRIPVALGVVWLALYFGRPTWGSLLDLLPLSRDLHFHRLIAGVHLAGIYAAGIGLALLWQWAMARRLVWRVAAALITALLLYPAYQERASYLAQNGRWMAESQTALAVEGRDIAGLVDWLEHAPPGRVYAGLPATWGKRYQVGAIPMYALLQGYGFDSVGYLYHALSLNADIQVLFDERRSEQYNLFNVRYVVAPIDQSLPEFVKPIKDFGRHRLYQVATSGYFDLVGSDMTLAGDKGEFYPAASTWLRSDLPRVKQHPDVRLDTPRLDYRQVFPLSEAKALIPQTPVPDDPPRGRILRERVESNAYVAEVQVERESTLLLKVTYHPNWRATVDGVPVSPIMVMPSYIGLKVTPGTHNVRLTYDPGLLRPALMALGVLTLLFLALAEWGSAQVPRFSHWLMPRRVTTLTRRRGLKATSWPWLHRPATKRARTALDTGARVTWRVQVGIYLLFFSVYLMSSAGHFFSTDHIGVYLTTQSLVERHSLAIKPINDAVKGQDGQFYAPFGLGQAIASIPFYLIGRWVDTVSPPPVKHYFSGVNLGDWGGTVPIFFVSLFNQFATPLTCLILFLFCIRLGFSPRASFLTALIYGFSTGAWVYAREYFQHPLESLLLLTSIYILFSHKADLKPRHVVLSGGLLAFGIMTRFNLVVTVPLLMAYILWLTWTPRGSAARSIRRASLYLLLFALPIILAFCALLYLNHLRFGNYLAFHTPGQAKGFSTPLLFGLYGNLFSVGRSIFLYSPPVVLALLSFREFYRWHRAAALLFISVVVSYLLVYSTYGFWEGGWAWGPRFLLACLPLLLIPLPYVWTTPARRIVVAMVAVLGIGVQILGVVINYDFVYWDWINMKLTPENAYLFVPNLSPIPTHLRNLLQLRYIDIWVVEVYKQFGVSVFLLTLTVPLLILAIALALLRNLMTAPIASDSISEVQP